MQSAPSRIGLAAVCCCFTFAVACSSGQPSVEARGTETERTVCSRLQDMVTALSDERPVDAVTAYDAMVAWAMESSVADAEKSSVLAPARRMAAITDARVDESKLPMSEVSDLARSAMTQSGDALGDVIDGCASIGVAIENLDGAGKPT